MNKEIIQNMIENFKKQFGIYFEVQGNNIDLKYVKQDSVGGMASNDFIVVNIGVNTGDIGITKKEKQIVLFLDDIDMYRRMTNMTYTKIILKLIIERLL